MQQLVDRKDTFNSKPVIDFLDLNIHSSDLIIRQPKVILQKIMDRKEYVTCCKFITALNVFVIGIHASKASRFEIFAFQSCPIGLYDH